MTMTNANHSSGAIAGGGSGSGSGTTTPANTSAAAAALNVYKTVAIIRGSDDVLTYEDTEGNFKSVADLHLAAVESVRTYILLLMSINWYNIVFCCFFMFNVQPFYFFAILFS